MNTTEIYTKQKRKYPNTKRKTTKNGEHDTQKTSRKMFFYENLSNGNLFVSVECVCVCVPKTNQ